MIPLLEDLNPEQREAVETTAGPVLILAGAGSGKTKTLTHRIAYLLGVKDVEPQSILAVTFTNKAAGEMRERVGRLLSRSQFDRSFMPFMGTFHSICVRLLRLEAKNIGVAPNFVIYDEADSLSALKHAMRQLRIDEKKFSPSLIAELVSSAKNEMITPAHYQKLASGAAQEVAARVYPLYQRVLREAGALDFDDLLFEAVSMLKDSPEMLKKWQTQFRYIMIDEYQDTNHAQYQLVKLLAAGHHNICVVGDDWQSIYSWRGANFQNILDFEKDYPESKVIKLEQNYRSTENILTAAHSVISKNMLRSEKKLWTKIGAGPGVTVELVGNEIAEAEFIVRKIRELAVLDKLDLSDFAVLYRTNAQSRSLEEAFVRAGLPYKMVGGVRFYERKEIKDVLAYLRLIFQPDDLVSFSRVINVPPRGLGDRSLEVFLDYCQNHELRLVDGLTEVSEIPGLTPRARQALSEFGSIVGALRVESDRLSLSELVEQTLKRTGYIKWLDDGSVLAGDRVENVRELVSVAKEYDEPGAEVFLEEIALITDLDNYAQESTGVTLMTLHMAKGLEFPVVFLAGMEEGIFPHSRSLFDNEQMEEERRLCYVGMTRAKRRLFLLHAASRLLFGRVMHNTPSRFLADVPGAVQERAYNLPETRRDLPKLELEVGDRVRHGRFGEGVVSEVRGDEVAVVFAGFGPKKLSLSFAPLEKISD